MHSIILARMPKLSERIYRSVREDHDQSVTSSSSVRDTRHDYMTDCEEWDAQDAERRLTKAFQHGGLTGWATSILQELDAESKVERRKRGHS